jgi:hypothetical protein
MPETHWAEAVKDAFNDGFMHGALSLDDEERENEEHAEILRQEAMDRWLAQRPAGQAFDGPAWDEWLAAEPR